jgi:hypothetical protein
MRFSLATFAALICLPLMAFAQDGPTDAQRDKARLAVETYVATQLKGDFLGLYNDSFAPSFRAAVSREEFLKGQNHSLKEHGVTQNITARNWSWYPGKGAAGLMAVAIDFDATTAKGFIRCGYFAFTETPDGSFKALREDSTFVPETKLATVTDEMRKEVLNRPGCRRFLAE